MKLYDHQQYALPILKERQFYCLLFPVGSGKTTTILHYIKEEGCKALIVAPPQVALSSWEFEADKWGLNLNCLQLVGKSPLCRRAEITADKGRADIWLCSYDLLDWLATEIKLQGIKKPFNVVILDEATFIKNPYSKRFKSALKISQGVGKRFILSGTLAIHNWLDIWAPLAWVSNGRLLWIGRDYEAWKNIVAVPKDQYSWMVTPHYREKLKKKLKTISFSVDKKKLNLPKVVYKPVKVLLSPMEFRLYNKVMGGAGGKVKLLKGAEIDITEGKQYINVLRQLSGGAVYTGVIDTIPRKYQTVGKSKIKAMLDTLELIEDNVIIVYQYRHELARIAQALPSLKVLKNDNDIKEWNAGGIKYLALHPASAGHGLNLQYGGNKMIWFSQTWSADYREQTIGRLTRSGGANYVVVFDLLAVGTIDITINSLVARKNNSWKNVLKEVDYARHT